MSANITRIEILSTQFHNSYEGVWVYRNNIARKYTATSKHRAKAHQLSAGLGLERNDFYMNHHEGGMYADYVKAVVWDCPKCGSKNKDYPYETALPMCETCEASITWSKIS